MRDISNKNWFWIENELIDREDISGMEKLMYMTLARFADINGKCFPSQDKLCKITGIKDYRTIVKYMEKLEEKGLIEIVKVTGKPNTYYLKNVKKEESEVCNEPPAKNVGTKNVGSSKICNEPPAKNVGLKIHIKNTQLKEKEIYKSDDELPFQSKEFIETYNDFKEMRKKKKDPYTARAEILVLKRLEKFSNGNEKVAIEILERSIIGGWSGVFALKDNSNQNFYEPKIRSQKELQEEFDRL